MTRCACHAHATERPGGPPALNLVRSDDCPEHGTEAEWERAERAKVSSFDKSVWERWDGGECDA